MSTRVATTDDLVLLWARGLALNPAWGPRLEQRPPEGDWLVWYIQAGRGWGKTRTGAEWLYGMSKNVPRVAIVAESFGEARDTCIEGESGIKSLHRDVRFNRSLGELFFPSGCIGKIFSADDPESLRGPNNYAAWCLVGETPVLMADGTERILADVREGDYVQTRQGPKRVIGQALTRRNTDVFQLHTMEGRDITGTGDHPVWVIGKGFTPLDSISKGDSVCVAIAESSKAGFITSAVRKPTTIPLLCSIARYGNRCMGQYRREATSTTSTVTSTITGLRTSRFLPTPSTASTTALRRLLRIVRGRAPSLSTQQIVSVERLSTRRDVYDIAVEDAREFFAGGILVHNCDEIAKWRYLKETWDNLMMTMRKGELPQTVVTTTPRPLPMLKKIKDYPTTVITHGSTYDNIDNLSKVFIDTIIKPYEGTQQGRQELDAEDIEDTEGALWKRAWIEQTRVTKAPELVRVVTALDPSATSTGDEAGVITGGIAICSCKGIAEMHGFILSDDSVQSSPENWAVAAVTAYHKYRADVLVAEDNNGGEMIETTIRTVKHAPPVKRIHASRGKQTRAEPISMLYQQGKVHHVGAFPQLEDELCSWVPGDASPNRLDALVWAFTELMVSQEKSRKIVIHGGAV